MVLSMYYAMRNILYSCVACTIDTADMTDALILHTVFDLISEHALISGHPPFFEIKKKILIFFFFNFFFWRDPLIIISGPSHATIFGSSVLHPG